MNSLAYLFRQFDVLASPKQPASAVIQPTSSHKSPKSSLQRVNAWSSKPFLLSPNQQTLPSKSRRSSSFPSTNFNHYQRKIINNSSPTMASISLSPPSASDTHIDRQIYFLRIFLLVWDSFRSVWSNIVASLLKRNTKSRSRTSLEEKESSEEEVDDPLVTRYNPETANAELDIPAQFTLRIGAHQQPAVHHHLLTKPDVFVHEVDSSISTQDQLSTEASSRSATPILRARKSAFHLPKTLVLDLDETLIHSTSRPMKYGSSSNFFGLGTWGRRNKGGGHTVEVFLGGRSTLYHVYKRPFVDFFLRTVSGWYTLVIFTASMREYADPVIDWLDAGRGILTNRLFRDSCTQLPNGAYTKDLSIIEADLSRVCLVDNSPISYKVNEANGIPIEGWTHDPYDQALLDLLPVLDSLRFTSDVRRVLGLRAHSFTQSRP